MQKVRIGVTGSGFMGRTHVDAARRLESTEIVAVAGGSRAPQLAKDYGIAHEPDAAALANRDDIDAVVIATPHYCHCDEALLMAATGKHALIEKPLATSVEDCDRMIAAFESRKLILSVGYHQRFRETNRRTRDAIQSGAIGPVRCIQTSALFDVETMRSGAQFDGDWNWWRDPRSVAHLINSAPHTIDLCRWWLQADVAHVAANCGTFRETNPNENTTMALLSFTDGAMCSFWSSSVAPSPGFSGEDFRFRIMGDEGLIDLNPYGELKITRAGEWETAYQQPQVGFDQANAAFEMGRMQAYCDQMQAFVDSIQGNQGAEGTAKDGRATVHCVLAMLEASARETVVVLD